MVAGSSIALTLLFLINLACIAGVVRIVAHKQPGWPAAAALALCLVAVGSTAVLAWQIGRIGTAFAKLGG